MPDQQRPPFRDAEAWLAARGVRREPIVDAPPAAGAAAPAAAGPEASVPPAAPGAADTSPVGAREAARLAAQADQDRQQAAAERRATPRQDDGLDDEAARALAFVRRSTTSAPQSEGRLRTKLLERGISAPAVEVALERARRVRLVDDQAMAAALVEEQRQRGHAPGRIRRQLQDRGFTPAVIQAALEACESEDQEAAAFDVALQRAARLTGVPAEAAFRRVHGFVARRGYPDALARKVAREAVFRVREQQEIAGR